MKLPFFPKPTLSLRPRPVIVPRDLSREDVLPTEELRRIFRQGVLERPEWYRAVRQVIHEVSAEALNDITDASLPNQQLRHAAGGFGNLSELLSRMEEYGNAPVTAEGGEETDR